VALLVAPSLGLRVDGDAFAVGWPVLVVGLGLALLAASRTAGPRAEAVAVAGGVVLGAGLVLGLQHATGGWDVWYVWPLAAFGGAGLGRVVHGLFARRPASVRGGATLLGVGVALSVLGTVIEGDATTTVLAAALVLLGVGVLLFRARPDARGAVDDPLDRV
jgi:hypothetical protein